MEAQLVNVSDATLRLQSIMLETGILGNLTAAATQELAFVAKAPPLGYTTYVLSPANDDDDDDDDDNDHGISGRSAGGGWPGAAVQAQAARVRAWHGGVNLADNSSEPGDVVRLSNRALDVAVSTRTGRLLSLRNTAAGLAADFRTEVSGCH